MSFGASSCRPEYNQNRFNVKPIPDILFRFRRRCVIGAIDLKGGPAVLIAIDTSAMIAILRLEVEADAFLRTVATAGSCFMSAASAMETAMVLAGASGDAVSWAPFDELLATAEVEIVPFDGEHRPPAPR
jgi:hypothetical protein